MKKIIKIALGMAGMVLLTTLPAYCTTIALNIGSTDGTYNSSTGMGSFDVTQLIETSGAFTQTINLPLADALILSFDTTSGSQSLALETNTAVTNPFSNIAISTKVYNATTSLGITGSSLITGYQVTGTAIAASVGAFLTDLYLPSNATLSIAGSISGAGTSIISDNLVLTANANVATPEPSTMFLLGAGLIALAAIARKRRFGNA